MKITSFFTLVIFLFSSNMFSQDTKSEDIKQLFELMYKNNLLEETMNSLFPALEQDYSQEENFEKEKFKEIIDLTTKLVKEMFDEEMVQIYSKHFTHKDIKNMIKFYESETGQNLLNKTPELTKEMMQVMMSKLIPMIQQSVKKEMEQVL